MRLYTEFEIVPDTIPLNTDQIDAIFDSGQLTGESWYTTTHPRQHFRTDWHDQGHWHLDVEGKCLVPTIIN